MPRHAWNSVTCNYSDMFTFEAFTVLRVIHILLYPVTLSSSQLTPNGRHQYMTEIMEGNVNPLNNYIASSLLTPNGRQQYMTEIVEGNVNPLNLYSLHWKKPSRQQAT